MSAPGDKPGWLRAYARGLLQGNLSQALREWRAPPEARHQDMDPTVAVNYSDGPMTYIADAICKRMAKAGWPSKVQEVYRSPRRQDELKRQGRSKASAFQSPHQYYEAADIVHKTLFWNAPPDYWEALAVVVRVIEADLRVHLVHGHYWRFTDSAHVELRDWRAFRDSLPYHTVPTPERLAQRFKEVLPGVSTPIKR